VANFVGVVVVVVVDKVCAMEVQVDVVHTVVVHIAHNHTGIDSQVK
jgi:hypothetical protein